MPHSAQAKKRLRQSKKRNLHNRSVKSEIRTMTKKLSGLVAEGNKAEAEKLYTSLVSKLDKAALRHIYHRNTVARKKSQVTKQLASIAS